MSNQPQPSDEGCAAARRAEIRQKMLDNSEAFMNEERVRMHASWADIEWLLGEVDRLARAVEALDHAAAWVIQTTAPSQRASARATLDALRKRMTVLAAPRHGRQEKAHKQWRLP
jgi:hypothetical protein